MRTVTAAQMQRIDHIITSRYGMPVFLLMENAGRVVAETVRDVLQKINAGRGMRNAEGRNPPSALSTPNSALIVVLCGSGHNGGDGVVAARYLKGWGYDAHVWWLKNPQLWLGDVALHYRMAQRFGVPFTSFAKIPIYQRARRLRQADVIVDALLGTGTKGEIHGLYREAIASINETRRPTVAIDIPSGLNADRGVPLGIAVKATVTVTMAAAKKGLLKPATRPYVGRLIVADIGIPKYLLP